MDFYSTVGGKRFIDGTMPRIATALEKIVKQNEKPKSTPKWRDEFNAWKSTHDWKSYSTRDQIDEALVNKLSEMLDEMENRLP